MSDTDIAQFRPSSDYTPYFASVNRNKRSIVIDLKRDEGRVYSRSKLAILVVALGLAMSTHGASAFAADWMPYVLPDSHGNCPADSTPTMFQGGTVRCHLHPRSQADCPPKSVFSVINGQGGCNPAPGSPGYARLPAGDPPPQHRCDHDSDCASGFCSVDGFCGPGFHRK